MKPVLLRFRCLAQTITRLANEVQTRLKGVKGKNAEHKKIRVDYLTRAAAQLAAYDD